MMKETPIFEEVFRSMLKLPGLWQKLLIGGLLSFIPGINLFAFGYLYRVSRAVRRAGRPVLPSWQLREEWRGLFMDGLRFAVVWLAFWLLPVLLALLVSWLLGVVFLGALANLFFISVVLYATVLFSSALYRYNMRQDFNDLLNLSLIFRMTWMELPGLLVPVFFFLGLVVWLLPFYGFSLFAGFFVLITYISLRYRSIEDRRHVVL
ncbi:MAG: DUF4013 domain-containing protein [Verrucomicrobia bacterium]|jgi:hypothetical protein|nr:DUF4013 domain-containing protein [Verrucomicrobiota bacterium]